MENILGLIKLRIIKGTNLLPHDTRSSDPYVLVTMTEQVTIHNLPLSFTPSQLIFWICLMNWVFVDTRRVSFQFKELDFRFPSYLFN